MMMDGDRDRGTEAARIVSGRIEWSLARVRFVLFFFPFRSLQGDAWCGQAEGAGNRIL
jgi:hypothetical protein